MPAFFGAVRCGCVCVPVNGFFERRLKASDNRLGKLPICHRRNKTAARVRNLYRSVLQNRKNPTVSLPFRRKDTRRNSFHLRLDGRSKGRLPFPKSHAFKRKGSHRDLRGISRRGAVPCPAAFSFLRASGGFELSLHGRDGLYSRDIGL